MSNLKEQPDEFEKHPKQDFQVERLAFFSDAVFAIAITLLVIEFKIPPITENSTFSEVCNQLYALKFNFIAILASFALIAMYWSRHHLLFKYIQNYNGKLLTANMFVLLPIIFFPFTTTFWAESMEFLYGNLKNADVNQNIFALGLHIFALNNFFASLMLGIFYWLAIIKYKELSFKMPEKEKVKFNFNILIGVIVFGAFSVVTFFTSNVFIIDLVVLPLLVILIVFRKRAIKFINK